MVAETKNIPRLMLMEGDMDAVSIRQIQSLFEDAMSIDNRDIILDMSKVRFIDSSGVGAVVSFFRRLAEVDRSLIIQGVQGQPQDLFTYLQIDKAIPIQ